MTLSNTVLLALALAALCAAARAQSFGPRLYETTIETGMPHLEENLRYATTHTRQCLGKQQLAQAFPILRHEALKGCRLDYEHDEGSAVSYVLRCASGSETSGRAHWRFEDAAIHGTFDVKLGGKNMTFYQRVTGKVVGTCIPPD